MPPRDRRHVQQRADPVVDRRGCSARTPQQLRQRRPHDERQHQQLVGVEREAERGDRADQPLQRREAAPPVAMVSMQRSIRPQPAKYFASVACPRPGARRQQRHDDHQQRRDDRHRHDRQQAEDHRTGRRPRDDVDAADRRGPAPRSPGGGAGDRRLHDRHRGDRRGRPERCPRARPTSCCPSRRAPRRAAATAPRSRRTRTASRCRRSTAARAAR